MAAAPIGAGSISMDMSGFSSGAGSKNVIQLNINKLEKARDEYRKLRNISDSPEIDKKLGEVERKLENLQNRLDSITSREEEKDDGKCETCENRKYQDGSDDPGVSFKMASKVGPEGAESAVRGHENEHVVRNQAKAAREGKEIVYQSVIIKRAICPECGRSYVAGGETKTVTRDKPDWKIELGTLGGAEKGKLLDTRA